MALRSEKALMNSIRKMGRGIAFSLKELQEKKGADCMECAKLIASTLGEGFSEAMAAEEAIGLRDIFFIDAGYLLTVKKCEDTDELRMSMDSTGLQTALQLIPGISCALYNAFAQIPGFTPLTAQAHVNASLAEAAVAVRALSGGTDSDDEDGDTPNNTSNDGKEPDCNGNES